MAQIFRSVRQKEKQDQKSAFLEETHDIEMQTIEYGLKLYHDAISNPGIFFMLSLKIFCTN